MAPYLALGLTLLVVVLVRIRLAGIPVERDEGEYAYAGQLILHGVPPYKEVYNTKLPGTYIAYALIMGLFGQTSWGIHTGLMLVNVASILLVFLIGRRVMDDVGAVVAAVSFALMSLNPWILGLAGHATHFVVLFALAGIWVLLSTKSSSSSSSSKSAEAAGARDVPARSVSDNQESLSTPESPVARVVAADRDGPRSAAPTRIFVSGLMFGLAFLMKQQGMFFGIFGLAYLVWTTISERSEIDEEARSGRRSNRIRPALLGPACVFCAGCAVPYFFTCVVLACAGVFSNFIFWTISYASKYASAIPITFGADMLKAGLRTVVGPNIVLWILPWAGALFIWWDERLESNQYSAISNQRRGRRTSQPTASSIQHPQHSTTPSLQSAGSRIQPPASSIQHSVSSPRFFLMALLCCSFISVSLGLYFREHYFIMLLPALALLTGAGVSRAWFLVRQDKSIELFLALPVLLAFVIGVVAALIGNGSTWFTMSANEASRSIYGTTLFLEAKKAGEYIRENSSPTSRVAVLGSEPEIYFYAHRRSASGHIYMYPLMETHPFAAKMQLEAVAEMERRNPEFAVYVDDDFSWLAKPESEHRIQDWWNAYWPAKMELAQTFDFEEGVERGTEADPQKSATATNHLLVFRQK